MTTDQENKMIIEYFGDEYIHNDWHFQIPVWSKLIHDSYNLILSTNLEMPDEISLAEILYRAAVWNDKPEEGHRVIVDLLGWYKKQKKIRKACN